MEQNQINQPVCYEEDEIDLREFFATIAKYKKMIFFIVFGVTLLTTIVLLALPNQYKIYTKLVPQEQPKGVNLRGLGALASMAGVNIGGGSGVTPDVAFKSLLDNYAFMKKFIIKNKFDKEFLDPKLEKDYIFALGFSGLYRLFHTNKEDEKINFFTTIYKPFVKRFSIDTDKKTSIITISFIHPSRNFAYNVLNAFLEQGTAYLVNKSLADINLQIDKYKNELAKTNNLELKSELAKLISSLIKQKVYINSSKYYKVKVITDPYIPDPKDKAKPKRGLIVIVAFITSFILAIFIVFFIEFLKKFKIDLALSEDITI